MGLAKVGLTKTVADLIAPIGRDVHRGSHVQGHRLARGWEKMMMGLCNALQAEG